MKKYRIRFYYGSDKSEDTSKGPRYFASEEEAHNWLEREGFHGRMLDYTKDHPISEFKDVRKTWNTRFKYNDYAILDVINE